MGADGSRAEPPGREGEAAVRVVMPTTRGPILVRSIAPLHPRLEQSVVTAGDDWRQVDISRDYDDFVRNVWRGRHPTAPSTRLALSDVPDAGRSWELPVVVAHLLARAPEPPDVTIWATGKVDDAMAPQPDEYEIPKKVAACGADLRERRAAGETVCAILPPPRGDAERAAHLAAFEALGVDVRFAATFEAVCAAIGLSERGPGAEGDEGGPDPGAGSDRPPERPRPGGRPWWKEKQRGLILVGLSTAVVAIALAASTTGGSSSAPAIRVTGLYAEGAATCGQMTMTGGVFIERETAVEAGAIRVEGEGLCGLRVANRGGDPLTLGHSPALARQLLSGGRFASGALMPRTEITLPFRGAYAAAKDAALIVEGERLALVVE